MISNTKNSVAHSYFYFSIYISLVAKLMYGPDPQRPSISKVGSHAYLAKAPCDYYVRVQCLFPSGMLTMTWIVQPAVD